MNHKRPIPTNVKIEESTEGYKRRFMERASAVSYSKRFSTGARRRTDLREQRAVSSIFSGLADCESVLDVPCGAGRLLSTLSESQRRVIEADVSCEMVFLAWRESQRLGVPAQFLDLDARDIPMGDRSVDSIFCNRLLHHILSAESRAAFLMEFHRVTRRYLIVSYFDYHRFGPFRRMLKAIKGRNVDYTRYPTLPQFLSELQDCGFALRSIVAVGPFWTTEKYLVLEKRGASSTYSPAADDRWSRGAIEPERQGA